MIVNAQIMTVGADPEAYHLQTAQRGTPQFCMSASGLRIFNQCPARWVAGYESPESDAKSFGALLDCRLLTTARFDERYAIKPESYENGKGETKPWNGNAGPCWEWLATHDRCEITTKAEVANADAAIASLCADPMIAALLDESDTQVHVSAMWQDDASGLSIPIKGLIDMVPRDDSQFAKSLADLKTTRNAALLPWQRWCYQSDYWVQAALYLDLYQAAKPNGDRNTFCFILVENFAPWQTGKRILSQDFTELGRGEYKRRLENYCACLKSGQWPGYDDTDESVQGFGIVRPEPFMAERAAFAPRFQFGEPATTEPATEEESDLIP